MKDKMASNDGCLSTSSHILQALITAASTLIIAFLNRHSHSLKLLTTLSGGLTIFNVIFHILHYDSSAKYEEKTWEIPAFPSPTNTPLSLLTVITWFCRQNVFISWTGYECYTWSPPYTVSQKYPVIFSYFPLWPQKRI